ncbi:MAG: outer membrane beta-barrel protein [Nibricoccus sp.]
MKKNALLLITVLCTAASLNAAGANKFFARPFAMFLEYTDEYFESEDGYGIAAGMFLDSNHSHELSVEFSSTHWEFSQPFMRFNNATLNTTGNGDATPVQANYRYYPFASTARFRPYIGASAGFAKLSGDIERILSGPWYEGKIDDWNFSFGASAGVSVRITDNFSAELGYRYLQINGSDVQTYHHGSGHLGVVIPFEDLKAHILTAAITIHF